MENKKDNLAEDKTQKIKREKNSRVVTDLYKKEILDTRIFVSVLKSKTYEDYRKIAKKIEEPESWGSLK